MDTNHVEQLAGRLVRGEVSLDQFLRELARPKTADLEEVQLDLDRRRRCGYPEAIFGEGKSLATLEKLIQRMLDENIDVLATRIDADTAAALVKRFPAARYNALGRTLRIELEIRNPKSEIRNTRSGEAKSEIRNAMSQINLSLDSRLPTPDSRSTSDFRPPTSDFKNTKPAVAIVTAGTTDLPVAEEARETLLWMGIEPRFIQDVGVAGPHRLQERLHLLTDVDAVVVVAGMEGALPSVVGGYIACPIIAVPTSVGYGASCGGLAALLSMLNSCAANVTVVNIDAGFKAGYVAGLIANRVAARSE